MKTIFLALGLGLVANYIYGKWKDGQVSSTNGQLASPQSAPMFAPVDTLITNDVMDTHADTATPSAQVPNTAGPTYPPTIAVDTGTASGGIGVVNGLPVLRSGAILAPLPYQGAIPAVQANPVLSTSKGYYSPIAIQPAYIEQKNAVLRSIAFQRAANCGLGRGCILDN